jgi:hypothetical protein
VTQQDVLDWVIFWADLAPYLAAVHGALSALALASETCGLWLLEQCS